jgi:hypothetical protein
MNDKQKIAALHASPIILIYTGKGEAITEFNYKEWLEGVLERYAKKEAWTYLLCTELPFMVVRKEIAAKRICYNDVAFVFKKDEVQVNRCGPEGYFLEELPQGVFKVTNDLYFTICRIRYAKNNA